MGFQGEVWGAMVGEGTVTEGAKSRWEASCRSDSVACVLCGIRDSKEVSLRALMDLVKSGEVCQIPVSSAYPEWGTERDWRRSEV